MNTDKITRVEVVDHSTPSDDQARGRVYVRWDDWIKIELSLQDEGRTLKIFITDRV